jgi:hypothetical protein
MNFEQKYYTIKRITQVKVLYEEYLVEKHKLDSPIEFDMIAPDIFRVDVRSLLLNKEVQRQLVAYKKK